MEGVVRSLLPDSFCIIFDGWSMDGTSMHYVAMYASFLDKQTLDPIKGIFVIFLFSCHANC